MEKTSKKPLSQSQENFLRVLELTTIDLNLACKISLTSRAVHYVWIKNNAEYARRVQEIYNKFNGDEKLREIIRLKNKQLSELTSENHQLRAANAQGVRLQPNPKKYWEMSKEELYADIQADLNDDEVVDGEMLEARPEVALEEILAQIQPLTDAERERIAQVCENQ